MNEQLHEQGSQAWFEARAGKWTASRFADLIAVNKRTGEPLKSFDDAVWDVVVERLAGKPIEGADGFALRWGAEVEPFAREAYELHSGLIVATCGFIQHPTRPHAGGSPDGLIGSDGILELKCPKNSAIHLARFLEGVPDEYIPQCQGNLWVTGRQWCDFVSYDPRMPESHRLFVRRLERDEEMIERIETAVAVAETHAAALLERIQREAA